MKFPALLYLTGSLLLLSAISMRGAEQAGLNSAPAVKDLNQPAAAASPENPVSIAQIQQLSLIAQFDRNGDHQLDAAERQAARAYLAQHPVPDAPPPAGRPGQMPPPEAALEPIGPGAKVSPSGVATFGDQPLYEPKVVRTLFLEFADADWEKELADFARTDVLVPARVTLDGKSYPGVGVRFHALAKPSSFAPGYKQSLDLRLDYTVAGQGIGGQRELRLLDSRTDPTFLRTMLYHRVAREYGPAPKANFVRVVINGEDWGIYVSVQPLDENLTQEYFGTPGGARWTVRPGGNLAYLGDDPAAYRRNYQLETPEDPAAWAALIQLCKIIAQTKSIDLKPALSPYLDLDSTVMFFALENTLLNQDGYGGTTGGYGLYLDPKGRFHLIPQGAEASFRLLQSSEYVDRRPEPAKGGKDKGEKGAPPGDAIPKGYNPNDFPHQTGTNLAMVLSYSFINKADTDLDGKVTREEWLNFGRTWFLVMDEDYMGVLSREQFIAKVRQVITPTSITDGRTRQTFGKDDPAGMIAQDFFTAMDTNHDGQLTQQEVTEAFARWFPQWSDPKTGILTPELLQRGFTGLFSQSVFQADQAFIAKHGELSPAEDPSGGGRGRKGGGNSVGLGPLNLLGLGGKGHSENTRSLLTFSVELDPLAALDDPTKPLLAKLLNEPTLRANYLDDIKDIAANWFTWAKLGPIAKEYHELIAGEIAKDTHKATSYQRFVQELDQDTTAGARDGDEAPSLRNFITERNSYLLKSDLLTGGN